MPIISAQVSIYPLKQPDLSPAIDSALRIFHSYNLQTTPGAMSTLIVGEQALVFRALQEAFSKTEKTSSAVMIVTFSNACPVSETEPLPDSIHYDPIGHVENDFDEPAPVDTLKTAESRLVLKPAFQQGLRGLENYRSVYVLFHFHKSQGYELLQHPQGDRTQPQRGVFSLHSPKRPNAIGCTEAELLKIEGKILTVRGLDALNNTPIIDIKPAQKREPAAGN